ncbi:MAG: M20/M25/M40 family metallo-hydrolase [Phycisphaerales bacterium]|nr:M20/M25/M40 family metallo-hydrolase [Phycisphaerales bacterium]
MLSPGEEKLRTGIAGRRVSLLEDLRLHVGLPTGGGNTAALDETRGLLTRRLEVLGARTEIVPGDAKPEWLFEPGGGGGQVPPTAVCRMPPQGDVLPRILICGHLDTVHDPKGSFRALCVAPDGRTAAGPGCVDMKGGLVITIAALEALAEAGIPASWTVLLNSDEETGSYHSERAIRAEARRHDFGLAVEPAMADGGLVVERMGSGQFMVECRGRAAHVGRDFENGVSAVTALAERLVRVAALADPVRGRIVNVGPLSGGVAANVVPDLARAWGNVRFPTKAVADELRAGLESMATGLGACPATDVRTSFQRPAKPLTPETGALAERARGAAEDLGQRLPFGKTGGVCDGNTMQDEGLPTIDTLGVRGGGLHTPLEWIEVGSLVERCQLMAVLISRLSRE